MSNHSRFHGKCNLPAAPLPQGIAAKAITQRIRLGTLTTHVCAFETTDPSAWVEHMRAVHGRTIRHAPTNSGRPWKAPKPKDRPGKLAAVLEQATYRFLPTNTAEYTEDDFRTGQYWSDARGGVYVLDLNPDANNPRLALIELKRVGSEDVWVRVNATQEAAAA